MSFRYRRETRYLANDILEELYLKMKLAVAEPTHLPYMMIYETDLIKPIVADDPVLAWSAFNLLIERNYITKNPHSGEAKNFKISDAGMSAYREGTLLLENKRDRLESIELTTKWILPITSVVISLIALAISIVKK